MTQSTGENPEEKTVTITDLAERWGYTAAEGPALQKFMGQEGPWTEAEADELDRRMHSLAEEDRFPGYTAPPILLVPPLEWPGHGPGCTCVHSPVEGGKGGAEALAAAFGLTPAERRTGVSDTAAAVMEELSVLRGHARNYGRCMGEVAAAMIALDDPAAGRTHLAAYQAASSGARAATTAVDASVARIRAWLPKLAGTRAVNADGVPLWFRPAAGTQDWLVTAMEEVPGEGWLPLLSR